MKDLEQIEDIMRIMIIQKIEDPIKEDLAVIAHKNLKNTEEKDRNLQILIDIKIISIIVDFNLKEDIPKLINMIMKNLLKYKIVKKDLDQDKEINQIVVINIEEDLNQLINLKNTIESISEIQIYIIYYGLSQAKRPGAGKGTQSAKMVEKYHFVHLSAGDLLREERSKKTQNAELIEEIIKNGQIVPVTLILYIYKSQKVIFQFQLFKKFIFFINYKISNKQTFQLFQISIKQIQFNHFHLYTFKFVTIFIKIIVLINLYGNVSYRLKIYKDMTLQVSLLIKGPECFSF